jgi:hypothetical protein
VMLPRHLQNQSAQYRRAYVEGTLLWLERVADAVAADARLQSGGTAQLLLMGRGNDSQWQHGSVESGAYVYIPVAGSAMAAAAAARAAAAAAVAAEVRAEAEAARMATTAAEAAAADAVLLSAADWVHKALMPRPGTTDPLPTRQHRAESPRRPPRQQRAESPRRRHTRKRQRGRL